MGNGITDVNITYLVFRVSNGMGNVIADVDISITYRKVANSSLSRLVAHFQIFRSLMKGKFDAYVL